VCQFSVEKVRERVRVVLCSWQLSIARWTAAYDVGTEPSSSLVLKYSIAIFVQSVYLLGVTPG